jgi:hypothetical protein
MAIDRQCPRCGGSKLLGWSELNDEERAIVTRLPASADYSVDERAAHHQWCARCWHEDTGRDAQEA